MERVNESDLSDDKARSKKKLYLTVSLVLNLLILGYFKYFNFFIDNINNVLAYLNIVYRAPIIDVLLPVGISFYTFQALSYSIDVYRGDIKAEKNPLRYALFVSFFPQLVAGPIERSKDLLHQLREKHNFDYDKFRSGLLLMLWGYFLKMVIADRIAIFVDTVYGNYTDYQGWYLVVATVLFAFQIYCDFSGYSTIAMGAAEIMGFKLTDNFKSPYFSQSVAEFWRRWHISLSSWFKDYVYIPLGGSRKGKTRKYFNIMVVFLLSGMWHGANWTYIIWGAINGVYQIIGDAFKPLKEKVNGLLGINTSSFSHHVLRCLITFILVDFTWIFFRASDMTSAVSIIKSIFSADNIHILFDCSLYTAGLDRSNYLLMIISIIILGIGDWFKYKGVKISDLVLKQDLWFRYVVIVAATLIVLVFGVYGSSYGVTSFIYFQF